MVGDFFKNGESLGQGHAAVAYGYLDVSNPTGEDHSLWLAINDTWNFDVQSHSKDGERLWVQEGGEISTRYNYPTVDWWPTPDIEQQEGVRVQGGNIPDGAVWGWQGFILTRPISEVSLLGDYRFNDPSELHNLIRFDNASGNIEIIEAPEQFGIEGDMLYLFTPDGSPIGFGLDSLFPEDFKVSFKYAGLGDGILQILLDDTLLRELDVNGGNLEELFFFDEDFHISSFGLDPYESYRLSFILKSSGDPELYFDDLSIRNLNFGNYQSAGVPEPSSILLLGLGLARFILRYKSRLAKKGRK